LQARTWKLLVDERCSANFLELREAEQTPRNEGYQCRWLATVN
jgi:hypothetical protein